MSSFELADSLVVKPDGSNGGAIPTANGESDIFVSAVQSNSNNMENLRVVVEYEAVDENVNASYFLYTVIETKSSSATRWIPLIRQNNGLNDIAGQNRKIFEVNPTLFDQTFGGTLDQGENSYQQRQDRPSDEWRVRIILDENRFGTADAFSEATISIHGDLN